MDFLTTRKFDSKECPGVKFTFHVPTVGRRMEMLRRQREASEDFEWRKAARALWNTMIKDFSGITLDGQVPSIDELFLNGPEELVDEVSRELLRMTTPLAAGAGGDEATIETARQQIAEAEARIAARKNSEPQSSSDTSEAGTRTAAAAPVTVKIQNESDPNEIAEEIPF